MKKLLLITIILFSIIYTQDYIDVIHLKNGDIIKGNIIENKINDYIRIEFQGGSILTYNYDQISSLEIERVEVPKSTDSLPLTRNIECYNHGLIEGRHHGGVGSFASGIASGLVGGLLGWGIAYLVVANDHPSPKYYKYEECGIEFREGYRETALKVKKTSLNIGGALGTTASVVLTLMILFP